MYANIVSTGSYIPEVKLNNEDLTQFPKNSIELIQTKTGVKSRRHASDEQCTSDLAIQAASVCLSKVGFESGDIDAIILTTSSPDRIQPATATRVQDAIAARNAFAFDINSVCSGGVYGTCLADSLIKSGMCRNVLLVGAETYSKILNPRDFSTYPYFGDGAGAILFCQNEHPHGVIRSLLRTDGSKSDIIQIPAGGTMLPYSKVSNSKDLYFKMNGKAVYDFAVTRGTEIINELISQTGIQKDEVKFIVPHQANINIIKDLSHRLEMDFDKFFVNLDRYGNIAAASTMIALDELLGSAKLIDGDLVIVVAFGGGLSWGANLIAI